MKKLIALTLSLILALVLAIPCAQADTEDFMGEILPDFTVRTLSGEPFTLSESLKTHDLVLINFWATWCGPCCYEFPFLEEAWERYSGRVDVIALNVMEPQATESLLKQFAKEYGLMFPIGQDEMGLFDSLDPRGIPTTLIVDKEMRIVSVEVGCKTSVEEFTELFDSLLPAAGENNL